MRLKLLAFLLLFSVFSAQTIAAVAQVATPATTSPSLTIPAGKVIPLTLVSPIKSKSTKIGDTVRAQVAFPITVGGQIAIPAGTYVEGIVNSIDAKKTKTNAGGLQIRFTKLIYANGYTVSFDAVNTVSQGMMLGLPNTVGLGSGIGMGMAVLPISLAGFQPMMGQTQTTLPPLPSVGPPKGLIIGLVVGFFALFAVLGIVLGHHRVSNMDTLLYDAGYQFQMATTVPVTVDAAQVSTAAAIATQ